jgi:hypothetical protein
LFCGSTIFRFRIPRTPFGDFQCVFPAALSLYLIFPRVEIQTMVIFSELITNSLKCRSHREVSIVSSSQVKNNELLFKTRLCCSTLASELTWKNYRKIVDERIPDQQRAIE